MQENSITKRNEPCIFICSLYAYNTHHFLSMKVQKGEKDREKKRERESLIVFYASIQWHWTFRHQKKKTGKREKPANITVEWSCCGKAITPMSDFLIIINDHHSHCNHKPIVINSFDVHHKSHNSEWNWQRKNKNCVSNKNRFKSRDFSAFVCDVWYMSARSPLRNHTYWIIKCKVERGRLHFYVHCVPIQLWMLIAFFLPLSTIGSNWGLLCFWPKQITLHTKQPTKPMSKWGLSLFSFSFFRKRQSQMLDISTTGWNFKPLKWPNKLSAFTIKSIKCEMKFYKMSKDCNIQRLGWRYVTNVKLLFELNEIPYGYLVIYFQQIGWNVNRVQDFFIIYSNENSLPHKILLGGIDAFFLSPDIGSTKKKTQKKNSKGIRWTNSEHSFLIRIFFIHIDNSSEWMNDILSKQQKRMPQQQPHWLSTKKKEKKSYYIFRMIDNTGMYVNIL